MAAGGKERRIVVFQKVRLVQETSAAGGNYYVTPLSLILHLPPPTHTHTQTHLHSCKPYLMPLLRWSTMKTVILPLFLQKNKRKQRRENVITGYSWFCCLETKKKNAEEKATPEYHLIVELFRAETRRDSSHVCLLMNLIRLSVNVQIITRPFLPLRVI